MQHEMSTTSPPPHKQTIVLRECAICQSSIYPAELTHQCAACGLVFHDECWQENFGCASYGCDQVNTLAPRVNVPPPADLPLPADEPVEPLPWDFLLLGASALAMALSALCYGIPSLLAAALVGWRIWKAKKYRNPILIAAAIVCLLGIVGGVLVSRFWFHAHDDYTAGG
jgi:hypothetical protein